jgi:formylglycine-generating enzyme required for sulfatase activity
MKTNPWKSLILLIPIYGTASFASLAQDACNPSPQPDDLVLPMPNGLKMVFRPVYLKIGNGPLAVKPFRMGGRANDNFRENPTEVQLGGQFIGNNPLTGQLDWRYFLGKYEVTEEQFSSVTTSGEKAGSPDGTLRGGFPKTDVTRLEIEKFLQDYNLWLFANARDALPKLDDEPGFVRLPTEAEWEFAARGGSVVDTDYFDQLVPYSGDLSRYEWFGGARSSHDKLQRIGLLEPNPLGLHDMLGNAAEIVSDLYQIEYVQGRAGGLIVRGGNFRTEESKLRSSFRTEQPLYTADFRAAHADNIGFRIILASPVFTSRQRLLQIETAWPAYSHSRPVPMPPTLSIAPKSEQTDAAVQNIQGLLTELEATIGREGHIPEAAQAKINLIRSSFVDVSANINSGQEKAAEGGVRLASIASQVMFTSLKRLRFDKRVLTQDSDPKDLESDTKDLKDRETNIVESRHTYEIACQQLGQLSLDVVERNFDSWISELAHRSIPEQVQATTVAKRYYLEYFTTKRLASDQWALELDKLAAKSISQE